MRIDKSLSPDRALISHVSPSGVIKIADDIYHQATLVIDNQVTSPWIMFVTR